MATLFASESYIKQNTQIYSNVETADVLPYIIRAQDIDIQKLLGTELFNDLLTKIQNNTLSTDEKTLVSILEPCVAHYTAYYAIPFNWAKFTARGLQNKTTDHSTGITLKDANQLAEKSRELGEFYSQRVIDFLRSPEYSNKFPLYNAANASKIKPERVSTYSSGMVLDDMDYLPLLRMGFIN